MTAAVIQAQDVRASRPPIRSPLTLRELLTPVFFHRRLVVFAFLIPVLLAVIVASLAKPVFVAESRLLILLGDDYVFHSDASGAGQSLTYDRAQIVQAEIQILSDRDLHASALKQVGLGRVYPDLADSPRGLETALLRFDKDLAIENVPQSNVVDLKLKNHAPAVAADTLNALIDLYIVKRRSIFQQADPVKVESEREALRARLTGLDDQISAFAAEHGFGDYDQALAAAQTNQATLAAQVQSLDQQYATRRGRAARLGAKLREAPSAIELYADHARSQQIESLTGNLLTLQAERRDAAAKFADNYPLIVDLDRRIAVLQEQIRAAPAKQVQGQRLGVNPTHQVLDNELADSQGDMAGLEQGRIAAVHALAEADARLKALTEIGPDFREMVRNRAVIEAAYGDLAKRAEDARLQDSLSRAQANVKVIQRATPPIQGKAGRMLLIGAGLVLGFVVAAAAVLFAAAFAETMTTPRDAEQKLDMPVVLSVPWRGDVVSWGAAGRRLRDALLNLDDALLMLRLAVSLSPKTCPTIQLIATDDEAGVSTLAMDLALLAATQGARRVLLIDVEPHDGDGAIGRLEAAGARFTGAPGQRILKVEGSSLSVSRPIGTRDLRIDENQWEGVLRTARQSFDVIVIDSPAMTRSKAGIVITPLVDLTLLVVDADHTRAAVARSLVEQVDAAGGQVLGAILNKRRVPIPPAIYRLL